MASETVSVLKEFGAHLIGRDVGKRIREKYFSGSPADWPRAVDLTGIEQVTESCADELFGILARREGLQVIRGIKLAGSTAPVREAIDYVLALVETPPPHLSQEAVARLLGRDGRKSRRLRTRVKHRRRTRAPRRSA